MFPQIKNNQRTPTQSQRIQKKYRVNKIKLSSLGRRTHNYALQVEKEKEAEKQQIIPSFAGLAAAAASFLLWLPQN